MQARRFGSTDLEVIANLLRPMRFANRDGSGGPGMCHRGGRRDYARSDEACLMEHAPHDLFVAPGGDDTAAPALDVLRHRNRPPAPGPARPPPSRRQLMTRSPLIHAHGIDRHASIHKR